MFIVGILYIDGSSFDIQLPLVHRGVYSFPIDTYRYC